MNKSIITGIFGSVIGMVATIAGILWILQYNNLSSMFQSALVSQNMFYILMNFIDERIFLLYFFQNLALDNVISSFTGVTGIFALLLIPMLILIGVGLYGLGKIEGRTIGIVGLIFGVIGAVLVTILLLAGGQKSGTTLTVASLWISQYIGPILFGTAPLHVKLVFLVDMMGVPTINATLLWSGLLVLGITMIIFGVTFLLVREGLETPSLSVATAVLFIISGIFLFAGVLFSWLAFIILFVALIMAALVFFGSREMG